MMTNCKRNSPLTTPRAGMLRLSPMYDRRGRCGVSLIDVAIAVSLLGVLFSMTLPGLMTVIQASRALQCQGKLRQLSQAVCQYQTVHDYLPPGSMAYLRMQLGKDVASYYSTQSFLLPFIEDGAANDLMNFSCRQAEWHADAVNSTAAHATIALLLCPSSDGDRIGRPGNSYRFNIGSDPNGTGLNPGHSLEGPFPTRAVLRPSAVVDGSAHTAGISEGTFGSFSRAFQQELDLAFVPRYWQNAPKYPSHHQWRRMCETLPRDFEFRTDGGKYWHVADQPSTLYNHGSEPNSALVDCGVRVHPHLGLFPARSYHGGYVQVAFVDGSVRRIEDAVDLGVWQAMGTRHGAEMEKRP